MPVFDYTAKVTYLAAFEQRLGVAFHAVSAYGAQRQALTTGAVTVHGEVHAARGNTIQRTVQLNVTIYDLDQRVIGTSNTTISPDVFYCFEVFALGVTLPVPVSQVAQIRLYPSAY